MPCSCDAWPAAHNQFHYCNSSKSDQSYSAPLPMSQSSIREKYLVRSNHWTTKLNSTVTVRVRNSEPDVDSRQCGKFFTVWSRGAGKSATKDKTDLQHTTVGDVFPLYDLFTFLQKKKHQQSANYLLTLKYRKKTSIIPSSLKGIQKMRNFYHSYRLIVLCTIIYRSLSIILQTVISIKSSCKNKTIRPRPFIILLEMRIKWLGKWSTRDPVHIAGSNRQKNCMACRLAVEYKIEPCNALANIKTKKKILQSSY